METIEFDTAYSAVTGERVAGVYIPTVDADTSIDAEGFDVLIDGQPDNLTDEWRAIVGKTRQHGYRGCIMHPSETADDDTIREWVRDAGGDVFAIVEVSACDHDGIPHDDCDCDECNDAEYCREYGCPNAPAGWAVIYRDADA